MSKHRLSLVMTARQDAPGSVVRIRYDIAAPVLDNKSGPRQTSWRDLVRRLANSMAKR